MKRTLLSTVVLLLLAAGNLRSAQAIDYRGYEELFGEPVTVSATGKPQRASDVPVSMEIMTAEDIRRSGARDIPQLLRRFAGVEVARNFSGHADVNVRGYNEVLSNRLLVLVNGRQVYLDTYGVTLWNSFPVQLSEIQQIELVRGPNTSLFGFNAMSGVVNIITYSPLEDDAGGVEVRGGTYQHREASAFKTFRLSDKLGIRVSAGMAAFDGFDRDSRPGPITDDEASTRRNVNMDAEYAISDYSRLRVEAGVNRLDEDQLVIFWSPNHSYSLIRHYKLNYTHDAKDWGLWNVQLYRNEADYRARGAKFNPSSPVTLDTGTIKNRLHTAQISSLFSLTDSHTARFGVEYRNNVLENNPSSPTSANLVGSGDDPAYMMDIYSVNAMWDWTVNERLSWTNSVRVDHWKTNRDGGLTLVNPVLTVNSSNTEPENTEFSFNSGLLYKPDGASAVRLSLARGLHVPSLLEMGQSLNNASVGYEAYGNPELDTESNLSAEVGYTRKLQDVDMQWGVNLFYEQLNDIIARTVHPIGATNPVADITYENAGDSRSIGVELSASGKLPGEAPGWYANYTYTHVRDEVDGQANHVLAFEGSQPKHKVNIGADYTYDGAWEFNLDAHYVSPTHFQAVTGDFIVPLKYAEIDDYVVLNMRVGYRIDEETSLSLDGFNLLDEHQERPAFRSSATGSTLGANEIGRAVLLTFRRRL